MVFTRHSLTNSGFHQTGKRRQHIDWWINLNHRFYFGVRNALTARKTNLSVVELTIYVDLSFGNVSSKIRNGVSNI